MKYVISRYNHDITPILPYIGNDYVLYDRSPEPLEGSIIVPNIGSDIYDKLTWVIDNYDNLPEVACLIKCNLFKYITEDEFKKVKDNKVFTPLLTQHHAESPGVCYYKDGIYYEVQNTWYLGPHKPKSMPIAYELAKLLKIADLAYVPFAPGSNYIVTKEDIHKHSKNFYIKLRSYLDWDVYPGEAQIMERGLYTLWK